jgi:hypothetical protein
MVDFTNMSRHDPSEGPQHFGMVLCSLVPVVRDTLGYSWTGFNGHAHHCWSLDPRCNIFGENGRFHRYESSRSVCEGRPQHFGMVLWSLVPVVRDTLGYSWTGFCKHTHRWGSPDPWHDIFGQNGRFHQYEPSRSACKLQRVFVEVANCSEFSDRLQIAASFRAGC